MNNGNDCETPDRRSAYNRRPISLLSFEVDTAYDSNVTIDTNITNGTIPKQEESRLPILLHNKGRCFSAGCCLYPNGCIQVISVQILTLIGCIFSLLTVIDCHFVSVNIERNVEDSNNNNFILNVLSRINNDMNLYDKKIGLGFYTFENPVSGECIWKSDANNENFIDDVKQIQDVYISFLGTGWNIGRASSTISTVFSIILFCIILSFTCVSYPKSIRYFIAIISMIPLVIVQGLTFTALMSSFCDDWNCTVDRTIGFSIGAICCHFISGLIFFLMKDYQEVHA